VSAGSLSGCSILQLHRLSINPYLCRRSLYRTFVKIQPSAGPYCLPKRMVPEAAKHLVCSRCGARNSETYNPIWARPDARVGGVGHYPDFMSKRD
jgi:hypothetical protein